MNGMGTGFFHWWAMGDGNGRGFPEWPRGTIIGGREGQDFFVPRAKKLGYQRTLVGRIGRHVGRQKLPEAWDLAGSRVGTPQIKEVRLGANGGNGGNAGAGNQAEPPALPALNLPNPSPPRPSTPGSAPPPPQSPGGGGVNKRGTETTGTTGARSSTPRPSGTMVGYRRDGTTIEYRATTGAPATT